jgi:hypothetical protein
MPATAKAVIIASRLNHRFSLRGLAKPLLQTRPPDLPLPPRSFGQAQPSSTCAPGAASTTLMSPK